MVSTLAAFALGFGLASASALPPPGKAAPPPPHGPASPPPPPGPKGAAPPPPGPPPPPPGPYQSISSGSVIEVTPSVASTIEPTATANATDVTSASSALTTDASAASTCADITITSTQTQDFPETIYERVTVTSTSTRSENTYAYIANTTVSSYVGPTWTETSVLNDIGTTYQTLYDYVSTGICTSTSTVNAESTSTVYTGSYTPTALTTYCPTSTAYEDVYASGEPVTSTVTETSIPVVTVISTAYEVYTDYYYDTTTTVTSHYSAFDYTTETSTQTYASDCTSTSYTTTASTTTTQSAKCAPTNFVTNLSSVGNQDGLDAENLWQKQDPANKDASTCCQVCVEDEDCVAMSFYSGCSLYRGSECGKSIQVTYDFPGANGFMAQAGCGAVVLAQ